MAGAVDDPAAWNQVFNIGADQPLALNDLAAARRGAMGVEPAIAHLPARHEVLHAHSSHDKIARVFGDRSTTSLDDGLRRWRRGCGPTAPGRRRRSRRSRSSGTCQRHGAGDNVREATVCRN